MIATGTVRKYTTGVILLTKLKRIICMKEQFAQKMEVPVSLMEFLLQTSGTFGGSFVQHFTLYDGF